MIKKIKGKFETNYPTEQQIRKYKRHGSEFVEDIKCIYAHECIIAPVIMHCTVSTPKKITFRSKLGFTQYDLTLHKERSVLKSVMDASEGEHMQTQYSVLANRIYLNFHDYKIAVEADEKVHKDRNIDHEIKMQKVLEKGFSCEFIRINTKMLLKTQMSK